MAEQKKPGGKAGLNNAKNYGLHHNKKIPTLAPLKIREGWREVGHGLHLVGSGLLDYIGGKAS